MGFFTLLIFKFVNEAPRWVYKNKRPVSIGIWITTTFLQWNHLYICFYWKFSPCSFFFNSTQKVVLVQLHPHLQQPHSDWNRTGFICHNEVHDIFREWKCLFLPTRFSSVQNKTVPRHWSLCHYNDVIITTMTSQITSLEVIYSTVYSGADQRKHQSSASLAFASGIHRCPANSPHKWPVTRKMWPFDDVIMQRVQLQVNRLNTNILVFRQ